MIITIDGPTASGKSTVARELAQQLHLFYIASGLLFRGLAYLLATHKKYTLDTIIDASPNDIQEMFNATLFSYEYDSNGEHIFFHNQEITQHLKSSTVDQLASVLGKNVNARAAILEYIRHLAHAHYIIIDGRDCGSVMFPHAKFKFFLTASLDVRAQRWQQMQKKLGAHITLDEAKKCIAQRDERDSTRDVAPLIVPKDAWIIDSSDKTQQEVVSFIKNVIIENTNTDFLLP